MRHTMLKLNTKFLALAMAFALLLCMTPAVFAAEASGTCGDSLNWSLSGDTLTITGSGAMYDYPESTMSPWYAYRKEIARVNLPEGLTRIGDLAFYDCSALELVSMPDSVTEAGWYAFSGCTSMTMLDLSSSLRIIEDGAFRNCSALPSVRLPSSLTSIGYQGFYRCEALTEITIPASVTELGASAFAFCYNLVRADIQAPITKLPAWTFYGCSRLTDITLPSTLTGVDQFSFYDCTSLSSVVYTGSEENKAQITADINRDLEGQTDDPRVRDEEYGQSSSNSVVEDSNGGVAGNMTTTTQTGNASVSSNITFNYPESGESSTSAQVNVTLENSEGWDEAADEVMEIVDFSGKTNVDVYIKDDSTLAGGALTDLAGKNVTVTVHNATGSVWKIDCATLEENSLQGEYDLSYERSDATEEQLELMGCAVGYQIRFTSNAQINAEVMIKLPVENARKNASLYQVKSGAEAQLLQTVVVDNDGYAHFYLASVDRWTEYLIGIDVPAANAGEAIIPEVLFQDYGVTDTLSNMDYVVTGRTSSWGLSINQVTWIMAGGMLAAVAAVGIIMFALNKRKLKKGYVPDLDEEDSE